MPNATSSDFTVIPAKAGIQDFLGVSKAYRWTKLKQP
jgi:hypothetical protein